MEDTPRVDLRSGVALRDLPDGGIVLGNVETEEVILVRRDDDFFAVGAHCTHYHGPLAEGLIVDDTVRCPWHHACFSLAILFAGFGLVSANNRTVIATLFVCALSVAGAIFLIEDVTHPLEGLMQISSAPARNALSRLGQ